MTQCPWCADPDSDYDPLYGEGLCHWHLLEFDGMSQAGYERMLAAEAADRQ